ncbi:hypothetical protein [Massilia sp. CF038]|uniref:hypothetical protein n=1 Tax=Massilia sp. CF038 TaxID=1881045 RepID=UPI00091530D1|nr:hypothetical protein [Massilia sp. CF038]SHH14870.1 hypothetical protein SAMN05428948_3028 [Massilia sp. CF038]
MSILKPVLILVILSTTLVCNYAWATEPPPRVGAEKPPPKDKAKNEPYGPKLTPRNTPPKRRAVRQIVDGMPVRPAPPAMGIVPPAHTVPQPALPQPIPSPQAQDGSYKGGVGNALIGPQGQLCSNNGITVQCF